MNGRVMAAAKYLCAPLRSQKAAYLLNMAGFPTRSFSAHDTYGICLNRSRVKQSRFFKKKCIFKEAIFQWIVTGRCRAQLQGALAQVG